MHLDDIELYAGTNDYLRSLLRMVDNFSRDIWKEFGLDKSGIQVIPKDHYEPKPDITLVTFTSKLWTGKTSTNT